MPDFISINDERHFPTEAEMAERRKAELQDENYLTVEILQLWSIHHSYAVTIDNEKEQMQVVGKDLGKLMFHLKQVLAKPGRNGQWSGWLKDHKIARATADRLVMRYRQTILGSENCLDEQIHEPTKDDILRLFRSIWPRLKKVLTTDESILQFVGCISTASGIHHQWREEGLMVFDPYVKIEDEPPADGGTVPEEADTEIV